MSDLNTALRARTSRKPRKCCWCHFTEFRGKATIAPGHRYLIHVTFPKAEGNNSGRVIVNIECVACASERDPYIPLAKAGACTTFCCGTTPCARPFENRGAPGHEHSCRQCVTQPAAVVLDTEMAVGHG